MSDICLKKLAYYLDNNVKYVFRRPTKTIKKCYNKKYLTVTDTNALIILMYPKN